MDIWTYDERYFVGFIIEDGQLTATKHPEDYDSTPDARKIGLNRENLDVTCRHVVTITTVVTILSAGGGSHITYQDETSVHMVCSGGSLGNNLESNGSTMGSTYTYNSGGGGGGGTSAPSGQTYTPPTVVTPTVINQLSNPCASEIYKQIKKGGLISAVSTGGSEYSKIIIDLLNKSQKYNVIISNSSNVKGNAHTKQRKLNEITGKYDILIELSNAYLSKATQLSIVRTIIH